MRAVPNMKSVTVDPLLLLSIDVGIYVFSQKYCTLSLARTLSLIVPLSLFLSSSLCFFLSLFVLSLYFSVYAIAYALENLRQQGILLNNR